MDSNCDEIWSPISRVYDPIANGSIDGTDTEPHDKAIVRALNSTYRPNAKVAGDPQCTIFIARLNHATDEPTLKQIFSKYGQIKQLTLVHDIITGSSKGYAFVEYYDASIVDRVYQETHGMMIDDREILVDYVCARVMPGWIPRRLGGGLGGRKESGQLRFGCRDRPFRKPIFLSSEDYQAGVRHSKMFGRYGRNSDRQSERLQGSSKTTRSPERSRSGRDERSRNESHGGDRARRSGSSEEDWRSRKRRREESRNMRQDREKRIKEEINTETKYSSSTDVSRSNDNLLNRRASDMKDRTSGNIKREVE